MSKRSTTALLSDRSRRMAFGDIVGRFVIRRHDVDALGHIAEAIDTAGSAGFFAGTATAELTIAHQLNAMAPDTTGEE